jgi:hypothetical protein
MVYGPTQSSEPLDCESVYVAKQLFGVERSEEARALLAGPWNITILIESANDLFKICSVNTSEAA